LVLLELLRLAESLELPKLPNWLELWELVRRVILLIDQVLPNLRQPGIEPIQVAKGTCLRCWSY
jgi:hypothetical protein